VVKTSFFISITYNTIGMLFALQGLVTPLFAAILMPLSSVTVVTFVTVASNLKAKGMHFRTPQTERNEAFV
jgi:Cu+-exporting ATPase